MKSYSLFTAGDRPCLIGGRNHHTGRIVFPCPEVEGFEAIELSRRGTLWSFTIQRFRPKSPPYAGPKDFTPFPVAYVELSGETIVEARLTGVAFEDITIGMPLELTSMSIDPDDPLSLRIPAFQPLGKNHE